MQSSMTEWDGNTRPPYLSPRNVYAGQEARAGESDTEQRTGSKLGKKKKNWERSISGCILSPCLFNLHAESIIRNARLDEAQAGIKIARRNINNLRYADDTTWMAESKEELKETLDKSEREEWKSWLTPQH